MAAYARRLYGPGQFHAVGPEELKLIPVPRVALIAILVVLTARGESAKQPIQLALPGHPGQASLRTADGYKIVQTSARPDGSEIGIRARDDAAHMEVLLFQRTYPGQASLVSEKCRDIILDGEKHDDHTVNVVFESKVDRPDGSSLALSAYTFDGQNGQKPVIVRGFFASNESCADLQVYSDDGKAGPDDPRVKRLFDGFSFDRKHAPDFADLLVYGEVLYRHNMFREAAPILERALAQLPPPAPENLAQRRILADETGLAYGSSGNLEKARAVFQDAIVRDPDYPYYYYNLACADVEEDNLVDAKTHLQQAFERKQNALPGEKLPDPTQDDAFSRFQGNPEFWHFLQSLR